MGVIASLGLYFGAHVLLRGGPIDLFAMVVAAVSFIAIQRFGAPVYFAVPAGALLGMAWRISGLG